MPKFVNKHAGVWAGLGTLFFSVYVTFQITLLNPQMEINNSVYFTLLFKVIGLVALPTGLALYLCMALAPARAFRIFFIFCLLSLPNCLSVVTCPSLSDASVLKSTFGNIESDCR